MATANDSILVTPGSGATVATHLLDSKEYQALIEADKVGHVAGSRSDYFAWVPPAANASSRYVGEIWNGTASTVVRVHGIWLVNSQSVHAGTNCQWDLEKTSATSSGTLFTPRPLDTTATAIPAGLVCRTGGSGGTLAHVLFSVYQFTEETGQASVAQFYNMLPVLGDTPVEIVLRPSEGIRVRQVTNITAGQTGLLFLFTWDN